MHRIRILDWVGILFFCLWFMAASPSLARNAEQVAGPPLVTLTVHDVPIGQVAKQITDMVGYEIRLQDIDQGEKVSGIFLNRDVESVFNLLLQSYNIVTMIDAGTHQMVVRALGRKQQQPSRADRFRQADTQPGIAGQGEGQTEDSGGDKIAPAGATNVTANSIDPFTGQTQEEIKALHTVQQKEIERQQNDPNTKEPFTGMTNAEIRALHEQQMREIRQNNPNGQ